MTTELPDTHPSTPAPVPLALKSNEGLGPLRELATECAAHSLSAVPGMRRSDYLAELLRQRPEWLRGSMAEPTRYMTRMHVLLHAVALRRMRALGPNVGAKAPT
jgi:hypothetical protein